MYISNIVKKFVYIIPGWNGILAQMQGQGQYDCEAPSFAPPNQYMSK